MSITTTPTQAEAAATSVRRPIGDAKPVAATSAYSDMADKAAKTSSELGALSSDAFQAFAEAGQIFAVESQNLLRDIAISSQAATTEALAGFRAVLSAKTVKEQLELQATQTRTAAIHAVDESSRFARAWIDLTEKAFAPLASRAYAAAGKLPTIKA